MDGSKTAAGGRDRNGARDGEASAETRPNDAPGPQKKPDPRKRLIIASVVVVAVLAGLIFGIRYLLYALAHATTDDAKIDADQVAITSRISERVAHLYVDTNQPVRRGQVLIRLDDRNERSQVSAAQASLDSAIASARAAALNVNLTRSQQSAERTQANGALAQANANVRSAREQTSSARGQIAVAQATAAAAAASVRGAAAAVPGAREDLRRAQADLARTASLVATGDVAQTQLDADRATERQAESQYRTDVAQVENARAQLVAAEQKRDAQVFATAGSEALVGVQQGAVTTAQGQLALNGSPYRVPTQVAQAGASTAQVGSARAQLRIANDNLSYTTIRSPIDGYVGEKAVELGRQVAPGENLMTIIPSHGIYVTANYKETQLGKMCVGDSADIKVDAYPGVDFNGRVSSLSPASENSFSLVPAQNATGNFVKITQRLPVRILFENPPDRYDLRPGLSVVTAVRTSGDSAKNGGCKKNRPAGPHA